MEKRKVKKHEDGIVVEFNKDRSVIECGESWVYETISKKVRKKHFGEIQELILNVDEEGKLIKLK